MTTVQITGIDLGGPGDYDDSWGHFVDDEGYLRKVRLTYGEAQAVIAELKTGEAVLYELEETDQVEAVPFPKRKPSEAEHTHGLERAMESVFNDQPE